MPRDRENEGTLLNGNLSPRLIAGLFFACVCAAPAPAAPHEAPVRYWTVLFYGAGDSSCEHDLMRNLSWVKKGLVEGQGVEFIALIDRNGKYSDDREAVGEKYRGTRLYRFGHNRVERLDGGAELPQISRTADSKLNLADPNVLQQFIRFGKAHYRARHYALDVYSHGIGRWMCPSETFKPDALYPAQISDVLSQQESVDLVVLDACLMGMIELAYQWRPGNGRFEASVLVAAAPGGIALPNKRFLERLRRPSARGATIGSTSEKDWDPATLTALDFGKLIVTKTEEHRRQGDSPKLDYSEESYACCDLSQSAAVKTAWDGLAVRLAKTKDSKRIMEGIRGSGSRPAAMNYMWKKHVADAWLYIPFFDLYDLAHRVQVSPACDESVHEQAERVCRATERFIVQSFGMEAYPGFQSSKNGISVVFPDGNAVTAGKKHWEYCRWYNPLDVRRFKDCYGRYAWCQDGAVPGNGVVENWYELLGSWYDPTGAISGYHW